MTTVEAQRQQKRRHRIRRRQDGFSWRCILSLHEMCKGRIGRLQQGNKPRPACPCRCHQEDEL